MKKLLLFSLSFLFTAMQVFAQAPFITRDSVHINNINASVLLHGDMWWDPASMAKKCEFPKGSGKDCSFASALWMSGYDGMGQLHVAAQTYRQDGNDYWPGPLDASGTLDSATSTHWAKFWKVRRSDIQYFQNLATHTAGNTPNSILTWPAAGNTYAAGNGGAPLPIAATTPMAPFADLNANGIYEPLLGEYPDVKGDEAVWWTFSDNGPTHDNVDGLPLGIEVHATSYAYARGTLIDNVVYYEYTLTNKSANTYNNFRVAQYTHEELGYYADDFIGFDSAHRMGICYNGSTDDGGVYGGHPPGSYGPYCPIKGMTMIELPGDVGTTYIPAGNYMSFNNDFSSIGLPTIDTICDHYMRGKKYNGMPYTDDYIPGGGYLPVGTGPVMRYFYTGDPSDVSGNSECAQNHGWSSKHTVQSSNDITLLPGATVKYVMALVVTDTNQGGCPGVSFHDINIVADTAWAVYHHPPPPLPAAIGNTATAEPVAIYPNPASTALYIDQPLSAGNNATIRVCNTVGQYIQLPSIKSSGQIIVNIASLPPGVYYLNYLTTTSQQVTKFIKE